MATILDTPPLSKLRPLLIAVLTFMLLALGSAHVRETVMFKLQENGVQRFYETEAHERRVEEVRMAGLKLGRKPNEERVAKVTRLPLPAQPRPQEPACDVAAARAPPHSPRAPPLS